MKVPGSLILQCDGAPNLRVCGDGHSTRFFDSRVDHPLNDWVIFALSVFASYDKSIPVHWLPPMTSSGLEVYLRSPWRWNTPNLSFHKSEFLVRVFRVVDSGFDIMCIWTSQISLCSIFQVSLISYISRLG
jgi:hypothetical protein